MNPHEPVHVVLELASWTEPVSGSLRSPGQPERDFVGWTELFAALDATLRASGNGSGLSRNETGTGDRYEGPTR